MDAGRTLYVRLAAHLGSGLNRGAAMVGAYGRKVDAQMASMERYAKSNQKELRSLGNVAGGFGLAAAVGVGLAVKKYAEFDKQMSSVQAATHASANEMAALRAEAIKLGADTQFSAVEAGQGIEELAKAGVSTADILGGGLKGALDLAAAGDLAVADSAEIAATALTQFGLSGKDIPHLADLLAAGAGKAQGSVTDLGAALNQSGLVAAGMGLSVEETTGSLAAFASAGLTGSDAGTSFKTAIQRLQAPMGRGAKALAEYGISAYDTQGKFVGIANVAEQLKTKLAGLTQEQKDAALAQIFGSDAIRVGTIMYKNGAKGMQAWIDKTNDAGYAAETARLRTDNLSGDIERLGGSLDSLLIGMGAGANGPMREFVQILEKLVDVAGSIPGPIKSTIVAGLLMTAMFGGAVFAATRLVGSVGQTRANIAMLRGQLVATSLPMRQFAANMLLMTGGQALKGAAIIGGIALASGAAGDSFGLQNTAMMALMGTMAGPFGVAAGLAIGGIMDIKAASAETEHQWDALMKRVADTSSLTKQQKALEDLDGALDKMQEIKRGTGLDWLDEDIEKLQKSKAAAQEYQAGISALLDNTFHKDKPLWSKDPTVEQMQQFASEVTPILEKVGLDAQKVFSEGPEGKHWSEATAAINEYRAATDTVAGQMDAVDAALANIDDSLVGTSDSADKLAVALKALFSPTMDLDAATQKYRDGLATMRAELEKNGATLDNNTIKGRANREVVRDQVDALTGQMIAAADAGRSSEYLSNMLERGRGKMLGQAEAAGINGDAMNNLLSYYNLTPELVSTLIQQQGAEKAKGDISDVNSGLNNLDGKTARPKVTIPGMDSAIEGLKSVFRNLTALDGKTAKSYIHVNKTVYDHGTTKDAFGSYRPGAGERGAIVPRYARGAFNQAHMVRAGVPRGMYGEPETQGESYIPHAMDRRKRSTEILGKTAAKFGYDLAPRGTQAAGRGGSTTVVHHYEGPLVGSLTVPALPGQDARPMVAELTYGLRRVQRGGKYN
jgi:TP901 family phage tail tape measure protein